MFFKVFKHANKGCIKVKLIFLPMGVRGGGSISQCHNAFYMLLQDNGQAKHHLKWCYAFQNTFQNVSPKINKFALHQFRFYTRTWKAEVAWVEGKIPSSWNNCMTSCRRCSRIRRCPFSWSLPPGVFGVRGELASPLSVMSDPVVQYTKS